MASKSITVRGDKSARAHIKRIKRNAADMTPIWPSVGAYLSRTMAQQFATEGARLGTPWQPLKPAYRLWKMRNGFSRKILVQQGALRSSFVGRPMGVEIYMKDRATFGSDQQTAVWHHGGTRRHGKRVNPPRPLLRVTPEIRDKIRDLVAQRVMGRKDVFL